MFEGWDSFYLLIGGASGALIGLLFVVVTLTTNLDRTQALRGAQVYMTPTVFHFAIVLSISALTGVPHLPGRAAAGLIGLAAGLGFIYAANVWRMMRRRAMPAPADPAHWTDVWCYAVWPGVIYLAMAGAAAALATGETWATDAVGAVTLALILLGIRNAWDLVTYLAPVAHDAAAGPPG